nr:putative integron gene cassette protein [uncultured bacterium]
MTFSMSTDARGRPCAKGATIAGVPRIAIPKQSGALSNVMAAGFLLMVVGAVVVSEIPVQILLFYLIASAATFGAYFLDKSAAIRGSWRTSESTLHLFALVGGWPGALIAQNRLRHKSRKQPFRAIFWATVVMNCAAFIGLFTPEGAKAWQFVVSLIV